MRSGVFCIAMHTYFTMGFCFYKFCVRFGVFLVGRLCPTAAPLIFCAGYGVGFIVGPIVGGTISSFVGYYGSAAVAGDIFCSCVVLCAVVLCCVVLCSVVLCSVV